MQNKIEIKMIASIQKLIGATIVAGFWVTAMPVAAESVAEFYKGRSIIIHMGFPGGGFCICPTCG